MFLFSRVTAGTSYPMLLIPMLTLATGMALTMAPLTGSIMSAVPLRKAGVGSAMNDTTRELGGALGVAVLGSITTARFAGELAPRLDGLPAASHDLASSGLTGVARVADGLAGPAGDALRTAADLAFVDALRFAAGIACVVILSAALGARLLLPRPSPQERADDTTGLPGGVAASTIEP
jgi:hypothetical protein